MSATLTFTNDGSVATVTGYSDIGDGSIVIPVTDGLGHNVVAIGDYAFAGNTNVISVDTTNATHLLTIGINSFNNCSSLTTITLGHGLQTIGENSLSSTGLTGITIPNTVTAIDGYAFNNNSALASVTFEAGSTLLTIGNGVFQGMSGNLITSLVIPDSVTTIGNYAISTCNHLTSLTIGSGVVSIGDAAFSYNSVLVDLIFNSGVAPTFGADVFSNTNFSNLTVGATSTGTISGWYASFQSFTGTLTIGSAVTGIAATAFSDGEGGSLFTGYLTIPASVTSIGDYAFLNCNAISGLVFNSGVAPVIGTGAFAGMYANWICTNLTVGATSTGTVSGWSSYFGSFAGTLTIGAGATSIDYYAFINCSGFTAVSISNSVTSIDEAFVNCTGLLSVTFEPTSKVGTLVSSFWGCAGLTGITLPDSVTSVGVNTFNGCSLLSAVSLPQSLTSIDATAFSGCAVSSITVRPNITIPAASIVNKGTAYGVNSGLVGTMSGGGEVIHGF